MTLARTLAAASIIIIATLGARDALADKLTKADWRKIEEDVAAFQKETFKEPAKAKELLSRILKDDSARAVAATLKMAEIVDEEAFALEAAAGLAALDDTGAKKEVQKQAAAAKNWRARQACVAACARLIETKGYRPVVEKALDDANADVAGIAVRTIARLKTDDCVEPLIAKMEKLDKDRGPVWEELRECLGELLARRLGSGAEYRSRWSELKQKGGLSAIGGDKDTPPPEPSAGPKTVSLFGREVCTRAVFILDISESMTAVDDPNIELPPGPTQSAPQKGGKPSADPRSRIERAKRELKKVLKGLPKEAKFNIIAFSTATRLWKGGKDGKPPTLQPNDDKTRDDAGQFIDKLEANGTTATDDALERAFQIEGARCFYLLSDGEPTRDGTNRIPTDTILGIIARENKDRGIRIHTLGFVGADREFMRAVAKSANGEYSDIK